MHWLLKMPVHQQAWYWLCRTDNMCCYSRFNFIYYELSQIQDMIQNVNISFMSFKTIQHINSLGPSDAIWRQRSGSTMAQVMACCLTAPGHYLNQCWLIINKVEWHSSKGEFTRDTSAINHWNYLENQGPEISFKFPRDNELIVNKRGPRYWKVPQAASNASTPATPNPPQT